MAYQSRDGFAFSVTTAFDADSYIDTFEVRVMAVGYADNAISRHDCDARLRPSIGSVALDWTRVSIPRMDGTAGGVEEFILPAAVAHNTLYRAVLKAVDAAGNAVFGMTSCVAVDKTQPEVLFSPYDPVEVIATPNDELFLAFDPSVDQPVLHVQAFADNDVSGLSALWMCCGTSVQSCDVAFDTVTGPLPALVARNGTWPTIAALTGEIVFADARYDGSQVCCEAHATWPIPGFLPVTAVAPCVHIDFTPPYTGSVFDGIVAGVEASFFSSSVAAVWRGFSDTT